MDTDSITSAAHAARSELQAVYLGFQAAHSGLACGLRPLAAPA